MPTKNTSLRKGFLDFQGNNFLQEGVNEKQLSDLGECVNRVLENHDLVSNF